MRVMSLLALLVLVPGGAAAAPLYCQATEQCRGDARSMCAASDLEIALHPQGDRRGQVWIAGSGPFAASREGLQRGERWTLDAFGGSHRLEMQADGRFLYLGNRGKRYTGYCKEG